MTSKTALKVARPTRQAKVTAPPRAVTPSPSSPERLREAAVELYHRREKRKQPPDGEFRQVGTRRVWVPTGSEWQSCCDSIQEPSEKVPHSYLQHVWSLTHVANLYKVDREELQKAYALLKKAPPLPNGEMVVDAVENLQRMFEEWLAGLGDTTHDGGLSDSLVSRFSELSEAVRERLSRLRADAQALGTVEEGLLHLSKVKRTLDTILEPTRT